MKDSRSCCPLPLIQTQISQPHFLPRPVQVSMATELSAFDMNLCKMSSPTEKQDDETPSDINFTWLAEYHPSPWYQVADRHCVLTDVSNECSLAQKVVVFPFSVIARLCVFKKKSPTRGIFRTVCFSTNLWVERWKNDLLFWSWVNSNSVSIEDVS